MIKRSLSHFVITLKTVLVILKMLGCLENIFKRVRHLNIDLDLNHRPRSRLEKVKVS